jgi:hypothetical protein
LNTKLIWPAGVEVVCPAAAIEDVRSNIHGTATCLPPVVEEIAVLPVGFVLERLELDELDEVDEVALPAVPDSLTEMTAKSSRPDAGFTMISLIVPIC